jgi:hypothetical protein
MKTDVRKFAMFRRERQQKGITSTRLYI